MKPGAIIHSVSRGVIYLGLEKAVALLSGIAYFALLLRWLGPRGYGTITLALSFAGLATMATGNLEVFLERYAAEYQAHGRVGTLRRAFRITLVVKTVLGGIAALVLVLLAPTLAHQFDNPDLAYLVPMFSVITACDGLYLAGRATLFGLQRFKWVAAVSVSFLVAKTLMVGILWGLLQGIPQLAVALAALTVAQGLAMAAGPWWMLRHARDSDGAPASLRTLGRAMVSYSAPLLGARAAFLSGQNLSKVVLGKLVDATQLGYFSFAFQTVERFVELVHTLPSSLLPSLTQLVARDERDRLRWVFDQAFRLVQVVACVLAFGLFVFAPEVTRIVGGNLFREAVPLLRIMALVPIVRTAQQPLTMLFQALRRPGLVLGLALVKLSVELGCYLTLVPTLELAGAGWANLAGAAAAYLGALVLAARVLPEGAGERARAVVRSLGLAAVVLPLGLVAERSLAMPWSLVARLALVPIGVASAFALGLVVRYDFEKVSTIPLGDGWIGRTRDVAVAAGGRLATALGPRRKAT